MAVMKKVPNSSICFDFLISLLFNCDAVKQANIEINEVATL